MQTQPGGRAGQGTMNKSVKVPDTTKIRYAPGHLSVASRSPSFRSGLETPLPCLGVIRFEEGRTAGMQHGGNLQYNCQVVDTNLTDGQYTVRLHNPCTACQFASSAVRISQLPAHGTSGTESLWRGVVDRATPCGWSGRGATTDKQRSASQTSRSWMGK